MYIVYTLHYQTFAVKVKNVVDTEEEAIEIMKQLALNFMSHEEGKRKARIFTETPFDTADILKGYILFSPDPSKVDVYHKDIITTNHIIWGDQQETKLNKIKAYSYTKVSEDNDYDEDILDDATDEHNLI